MRAPAWLSSGLTRAASKALAERLPEMVATYGDGRRFRIPAGDAMYAQVFIYGLYEPAESAVIAKLLRPGDLAVDVGANFGWFSLLMAAAVGDQGRVLAVEPVPAIFAELQANRALNPRARIEVREVALGEAPGTVELNVFEGLAHGHASMSTLGRSDFVSYEARLTTLDLLLAHEANIPALIKMDVEGAERGVIAGARSLAAAEAPPMWMIEVNTETSAAFGYRPADLVADLNARAAHAIYRVAEQGLRPEREVAAAPHGTTWVCVPEPHSDRARPLVVGDPVAART